MRLILLICVATLICSWSFGQIQNGSKSSHQTETKNKPSAALGSVNQNSETEMPKVQSEEEAPQNRWDIMDILTLFIVLLTACLAGISYLQARLSADTAKRQLRAYICVEPPTDRLPRVEINGNIVRLLLYPTMRNVGQTPAHEVRVVGKGRILQPPLASDFDYHIDIAPDDSVTMLAPGQPRGIIIRLEDSLSRADYNNLPDATVRIHVYGSVVYKDEFWKKRMAPRETNFCYRIELRRVEGGMEADWVSTNKHNDAT